MDRSINNPELFIHSNVLGVSVLMDACLRFGVNRFHQVSTDEVYGDLPLESTSAVSYTHLDVYKRQSSVWEILFIRR